MVDFDDRKKAFENKFALDEENKFKVEARARKFLALWAAQRMGKSEEDSLEYAVSVVKDGVSLGLEGIKNRILEDVQAKNIDDIDKEKIDNKYDMLYDVALHQIKSNH